MVVKIVPKFTAAQIARIVAGRKQRIYDAILLNLQRVGEQFVVDCRNLSTYKDQTGNLRSSIGYIILKDGR